MGHIQIKFSQFGVFLTGYLLKIAFDSPDVIWDESRSRLGLQLTRPEARSPARRAYSAVKGEGRQGLQGWI
jgi:hypothetical protein